MCCSGEFSLSKLNALEALDRVVLIKIKKSNRLLSVTVICFSYGGLGNLQEKLGDMWVIYRIAGVSKTFWRVLFVL